MRKTAVEPASYVKALTQCGWMEALPRRAVAALNRGVAAAVRAGSEPWEGIPSVGPDPNLRVWTSQGDYARLLRRFSALSYGVLTMSLVRERRVSDDQLRIEFGFGGELRWITLDWGDDRLYQSLDAMFKLVDSPLRFICVQDESGEFVMTTPDAFARAMERDLLPGGRSRRGRRTRR